MGDLALLYRVVENLGVAGLFVFVLYKLLDKWASKFLAGTVAQGEAIVRQAEAMSAMVASFNLLHSEQKDLTLAVRVLGVKLRRLLKEPASEMELGLLAELQARAELEAESFRKEGLPK